MENEDRKQNEKKQDDNKPAETNLELAKALKEARENSVSKEEYQKLLDENRQLVNEVINGSNDGGGQKEETKKTPADIKALREKLYGPKCSELSNLDYCDTMLKLRDAVIEVEGLDPFLPHGANIKPTELDIEKAEAVAETMRECIKEADGDSGVFTALLQAKTNNDSQALTAHLKKIGAIK